VSAGRLVFPALRWRAESGFAHQTRAIEQALEFGAGGFILFGGTVESVRELSRWLRREAGRPLLIAADLERGAGQQVDGLDELPPPLALASLGDLALVRGAGVLTATQALAVGINWVFGPVADLDLEPDNPIVQTRAFGAEPVSVARQVSAWVHGCQGAGALACAKHFPGHGRTRTDSHVTVPVVDASSETLRQEDLLPFQAAVDAGVGSVMTAHVAFPALDPSGTPATFSAPILSVLRHDLQFDGLVVSDALMMEGARAGRSPVEAAVAALRAGVDLLLYPEDPPAVAAALETFAAADSELAATMEQAVARLEAVASEVDAEAPPEGAARAGSARAVADWLLDAPPVRGSPPVLVRPLELIVVDDDLGGPWPASATIHVERGVKARGVEVSTGGTGSRVVLVFSEPRAWKGRAGFGPECRSALERYAPGAALVVLFGHPRLVLEIPGAAPVVVAWHRERLMQEAVARWLAERTR